MRKYDSVVIGAGPAGITAALYLCRSGAKVALIEMLSPGGQLLKTSEIENYPGFPKGSAGFELADTFSAHLDRYELDRLRGKVENIVKDGKYFRLKLEEENDEILATSVILCTGAVPRKIGIDREEALTGHGISYCAMCDGFFFKNREVAVIGGGNSALEEALYLSKIVKKVYLIHRRNEFRADKVFVDKIRANDKIELVLSHTVSELRGAKDLESIIVESTVDKSTKEIAVDGLFVFVGYDPQNTGIPSDLELDVNGFVVTDTEMRTNVAGFYAAGDIRSKLCRQVVTAVGDGATAAHVAFAYIEQMEE